MNCVESASTPVGHAVTSLPPTHATQCSSTHVHDPHGFPSLPEGEKRVEWLEYDVSELGLGQGAVV